MIYKALNNCCSPCSRNVQTMFDGSFNRWLGMQSSALEKSENMALACVLFSKLVCVTFVIWSSCVSYENDFRNPCQFLNWDCVYELGKPRIPGIVSRFSKSGKVGEFPLLRNVRALKITTVKHTTFSQSLSTCPHAGPRESFALTKQAKAHE